MKEQIHWKEVKKVISTFIHRKEEYKCVFSFFFSQSILNIIKISEVTELVTLFFSEYYLI